MNKRTYTILVVPEHSSQVRRVKISHRLLLNGALAGLFVIAATLFAGVHYWYVVDQAGENHSLKNENVMLSTRLKLVQDEIARIDGQLQRIDRFATRLRAITQLSDPERNLAIGPLSDDVEENPPEVLYAPDERIEFEDELIDSKLALRLVNSSLESLGEQTKLQDTNMQELDEYFALDSLRIGALPSIRPAPSRLLTSKFGMRTDPYTNRQVMHKGIDLAAEHGTEVRTTGGGVVVFAGNRGGYGKTLVIDHGYGFQTHYTHLSSYHVTVGQRVERGQLIGGVGNTGRSTGPHLHYEVRFNGIPQDPEQFIIE